LPERERMNIRTEGALKRIIDEVKEYRKLPSNMIGGNDIDLVEAWINGKEVKD
jgi:hypothetical protein